MSLRIVIIPALITLAVTLLRLIGELRHWPERWFSTGTGGIVPSGVSWVFGITWLAAVFGAYFAMKLAGARMRPKSQAKALFFVVLGVLIFLAYRPVVGLVGTHFGVGFPHRLIFIWTLWILAGAIQYFGWPELFKVLLAYAYAARIPVAVIMFFAMQGNWGTHYDYAGAQIPLEGILRYLWLAFFPQLVGWIGFTLVLGSAAGTLAITLVGLSGLPAQEKIDHIDVNIMS